MKKQHILPLFIVWLMFLLGCKKEKLPEPSQTGANVIACKVNGKAWIADPGTSFNGKKFSLTYSNLFKPRHYFVLSANRITKNNNSHILLALEDVKSIGTQYFAFETQSYPSNLYYKNHAAYMEDKPDNKEYVTNSRYTGSINITRLDTISHIAAGTFEFTAESTDGSGQTVKITDGRFDVKY